MYIKALNFWNEKDWEKYFSQFEPLTNQKKLLVKKILCSETKEEIEENFSILKRYGIINGIGPGFFISFFRWFLNLCFEGVRYEWHDIRFWIGWTLDDFHEANYGLFKYSLLTIAENYIVFAKIQSPFFIKIFQKLFLNVQSIIMFLIALFCFRACEIFGKSSFRFNEG